MSMIRRAVLDLLLFLLMLVAGYIILNARRVYRHQPKPLPQWLKSQEP